MANPKTLANRTKINGFRENFNAKFVVSMVMKTNPVNDKNIRRIQRFSLALPVRVASGVDEETGWNEITRLNDVSAFGAGFNLKHPIKRGSLLQMTIPLPRQMRCYDYTEPQYRIWGLVRTCVPVEDADDKQNAVGVAFIGKKPPESYYENPAKLYDISHQKEDKLWQVIEAVEKPNDSPKFEETRRHSRLSIPANVIVEKIDADGNVAASETTVTENLSLSGASVFSTFAMEKGEFVRVRSEQYNVSIISVVRGFHKGADGIPRLHLEFIDQLFPLEGIE